MPRRRSLEETRAYIRRIAEARAWVLNPDAEFTEDLAQGLTVNQNRLGWYRCPCRDSDGPVEANRDICCPCTYAAADIEEHGRCYCALFYAPGHPALAREPEPIPERRPTR